MYKVITKRLPTTQIRTIIQQEEIQIHIRENLVLNQEIIQMSQEVIVLTKIFKQALEEVSIILTAMETKNMFQNSRNTNYNYLYNPQNFIFCGFFIIMVGLINAC